MKTRFAAERHIDAPADVVYHCIADYRVHHRPEGFLPPAFSALDVRRGGVGAGTEVGWDVELGGRRRTIRAVITEPEPGRTLVETAPGIVTTFTVTPAASGPGCLVRFDSVFDEPGIGGVLLRLSAARLLGPVYRDELARLEAHALAHPPLGRS
jgi:hypothetical protein